MLTRGFAYNPTQASISGTSNLDTLCIQEQALDLSLSPGGLTWWMGPDETDVYVVAKDVPSEDFPTPLGDFGGVQFWTCADDSASFISLVSTLSGSSQNSAFDAYTWLTANNYWTNFNPLVTNGLLINWDMSKAGSYPGTGNDIYNLAAPASPNTHGGNVPPWAQFSTNYGGYIVIDSINSSPELISTKTNINPYLSPINTSTVISAFLWIRPTGNGVILQESSKTGWRNTQIELVGGTLRFSVWPQTQIITSSIATSLNEWYYVGYVYDGTTLTAYVNGVVAGTATFARQTPYTNGPNLPYYYIIGIVDPDFNLGDGTYGDFGFGGFHVYTTALSGAEVLNNFNVTKSRFGL